MTSEAAWDPAAGTDIEAAFPAECTEAARIEDADCPFDEATDVARGGGFPAAELGLVSRNVEMWRPIWLRTLAFGGLTSSMDTCAEAEGASVATTPGGGG